MFAHVLDATLTYGLCYGNVSSISQELPACLWQRWEKRLLTHAGYDVSHQHTFPFFFGCNQNISKTCIFRISKILFCSFWWWNTKQILAFLSDFQGGQFALCVQAPGRRDSRFPRFFSCIFFFQLWSGKLLWRCANEAVCFFRSPRWFPDAWWDENGGSHKGSWGITLW